jgi:hypothetical protein
MRPIKKAIFTLRVDDYAPEICELTFPLLHNYANKIGAEFVVIDQRRFPDWPPVYEKLQIYELAQEMQNDWNIYIDADALIHPDLMDLTTMLSKDTVAHHGSDFASQRWKYDRFFLRDGRHIGSGNWFTIASDWCVDLWRPLDDLTLDEACINISPTLQERLSGCFDSSHLIDDYTLSRNIAKYGLKFVTIRKLLSDIDPNLQGLFWHQYLVKADQKLLEMKQMLKTWGLL